MKSFRLEKPKQRQKPKQNQNQNQNTKKQEEIGTLQAVIILLHTLLAIAILVASLIFGYHCIKSGRQIQKTSQELLKTIK